MATLTPEQNDFLKSHHIPLDKTFDASGLSSKEYKAKMKENGTLVAYGVPPCLKGHTLKNKQANCLQCNPQAIASIKRQATAGDVYIAVSPSQLLAKIAVTEDASDILNQMNANNHAEINDWQLALTGKTDSLGQMQSHLQQRLADCQIAKKLTANGKTIKASSIYDIDIYEALEVLNEKPFTLATMDNGVIDNFHSRYTQRENERKLEAIKLAETKAQHEQAQLAAQVAQKQAKLEVQQREQQALKEQKLAQKRLRQQEIEAKKAQKLHNKQAKLIAQNNDTTQVKGGLVATPTTDKPSINISEKLPILANQTLLWVFAVIIIIIGIAIAVYLLNK